ncbi:hypothetical protein GGR58DRAFT_505086 [Xylaria digitata]|nr:hypothetical protein GGR58DRAFT_505086 [Xylaria digitata]
MILLSSRSQPSRLSGGIDTRAGLPNSWNNISPSPDPPSTLGYQYPFFSESLSNPSVQKLLPYQEPLEPSHATGPLQTPSATPELSDDDAYSRRPGLFLVQDPIIEKLNRLRLVGNKDPLPPLEGLYHQEFLNQATRKWGDLQNTHSTTYQQPSPPQNTKKRRTTSGKGCTTGKKTWHSNVKYWTEELDFIRYQRIDRALGWGKVQKKFRKKFPMPYSPEPRNTGGLQGVNYRQNKCLPLIFSNGRLGFMENGHIQLVWIPTRKQTKENNKGEDFTLVHLYPERAMNYPWVKKEGRLRAALLNEDRQKQKEQARLDAIKRGTYIEKLPPSIPCGCCPSKDRERYKKLSDNKQSPPRRTRYRPRARP